MRTPVALVGMAICSLAGVAVGFVVGTPKRPHEDDHVVLRQIMASENRIVDTLKHNNLAAFASLLPEDLIDVDSDGIHDKAQWLKAFEEQKQTGFLFTNFKFEHPRIVRISSDAAVMIASEQYGVVEKSKPHDVHVYTQALYVRRSGKWVPLVYQDTDASDAPQLFTGQPDRG